MPRRLNEIVASLPERERRRIAARAERLIAEELSLRALRKAIGRTQASVAKRLKVGQHAVSKIEARGDMYVSTLRGFIRAMGGQLDLMARFPGRPSVRLEKLGAAPSRGRRAA